MTSRETVLETVRVHGEEMGEAGAAYIDVDMPSGREFVCTKTYEPGAIDLEDLVVWLVKNRIELLLTKINESGKFHISPGGGMPVVYHFLQPEGVRFGGTAPGLPTNDEEAMRFIPEGSDAGFRDALLGLYKARRGQGDSIEKALEYTLLKGAGK